MQIQQDVASLRVRPVHQRVHEQLADDDFLERGNGGAEHASGQLVALSDIRHLLPDCIHQLDGRQTVIVPHLLAHLDATLVVLNG